MTDDTIRFYRSSDQPFGAFSNLFRRPFVLDGRRWDCAERAYQYQKAAKQEVAEWIVAAPDPALCAAAAHGLYRWHVREGWATIKVEHMRRVLRAKFEQHADLAVLLVETGDRRIAETGTTDNTVNRFWGEVPRRRGGLVTDEYRGENMLGRLLMELRGDIRRSAA